MTINNTKKAPPAKAPAGRGKGPATRYPAAISAQVKQSFKDALAAEALEIMRKEGMERPIEGMAIRHVLQVGLEALGWRDL